MICEKCNRLITDTMNFCPYCGYQTNAVAERSRITQKLEIDKAMEDKNFNFIWDKILNEKNTYAEYVYEKFFRELIRPINTPQDFSSCTEKILYLAEKGYSYPYYLYGYSQIWAYQEHGLISGLKYFMANPKKVEEGKSRVLKMAEFGQASAQAAVGIWSKNGTMGQTKNDVRAFKMLKAAADKLHPMALYYLGVCYQNAELGLERNSILAAKYIEKAAFFGEKKAVETMGEYPIETADKTVISPLAEKYMSMLNFNRLNEPYEECLS